jgi:hypothetical protein
MLIWDRGSRQSGAHLYTKQVAAATRRSAMREVPKSKLHAGSRRETDRPSTEKRRPVVVAALARDQTKDPRATTTTRFFFF